MTHSSRSFSGAYRPRHRERGGTAITFALLLIPMMLVVGLATDFARMLEFKSALQATVDEAALAGAAVFTDSAHEAMAARVATEYFDSAALPPRLSLSAPTVTTNVNGTTNENLYMGAIQPRSPYALATAHSRGGAHRLGAAHAAGGAHRLGTVHALGTVRPLGSGSPFIQRAHVVWPSAAPAHTVTVTATAKVGLTLLSLAIPNTGQTITATATAGQPVVTADLSFSHVNWWACDGNTVYMYAVPPAANGTGYDFSKVPAFTVANGSHQGNYYEIGTSYPSTIPLGQLPDGQEMPSIGVNQPIGVMLRNDTNGNTSTCGAPVTGANSYGAPNGGSQAFYSSLLQNNQSPSEYSNYSYTVKVQTTSGAITKVTTTLPPSLRYPKGATINEPLAPSGYNTLSAYLGVNDPASGHSNCSSSSSTSGSTKTTTYRCKTQYFTTKTSKKPNCLLYVETGVTDDYIWNLGDTTSAPAPALGKCFDTQTGGSQYASPSCAQLSAMATGGAGNVSPAAVFWWDDGGGVTSTEEFYKPQGHCSSASPGGAGYGEDCLYKNNFFVAICRLMGGFGGGYTEVVLTQ